MSSPRAPAGLGVAGRALWRCLTGAYSFEPAELAVLGAACSQLDDIAALEQLVAEQGLTVAGSAGQTRVHPAIAEIRQGRVALTRMVGALALPDEAERPMTATSQKAKRAADLRWSRKRAEIERRERGPDGVA